MTSGNTGFALGKRGNYPLKLKGSVNREIRKPVNYYEAIINQKAF